MNIDVAVELFPIDIWIEIVNNMPVVYGRVCSLSRTLRRRFRPHLDHYKSASCRTIYYIFEHVSLLPNGKKHGKCIQFYRSGIPYIISNYVDGEIHGQSEYYFANGKLKSKYNYVNGKRHGKHIEFYLNFDSPLYEDNYVDGLKHGICISYYITGVKEREEEYIYGNLIKTIEYYTSGKIYKERP